MRPRLKLNLISEKKKQIKEVYRQECDKQDAQMMDDLGYIRCTSCHITLVNPRGVAIRSWGHSHNLPKGRFPIHEANPKNFSPRCQDWAGRRGCHEKLDDLDIESIVKFIDFDSIMEVRKELAPIEYNKTVTLLNEHGVNPGYEYVDINR